jgi:hypothetical protein
MTSPLAFEHTLIIPAPDYFVEINATLEVHLRSTDSYLSPYKNCHWKNTDSKNENATRCSSFSGGWFRQMLKSIPSLFLILINNCDGCLGKGLLNVDKRKLFQLNFKSEFCFLLTAWRPPPRTPHDSPVVVDHWCKLRCNYTEPKPTRIKMPNAFQCIPQITNKLTPWVG